MCPTVSISPTPVISAAWSQQVTHGLDCLRTSRLENMWDQCAYVSRHCRVDPAKAGNICNNGAHSGRLIKFHAFKCGLQDLEFTWVFTSNFTGGPEATTLFTNVKARPGPPRFRHWALGSKWGFRHPQPEHHQGLSHWNRTRTLLTLVKTAKLNFSKWSMPRMLLIGNVHEADSWQTFQNCVCVGVGDSLHKKHCTAWGKKRDRCVEHTLPNI